MDLVQVLPNALKCPCVSIKHALKKQGIKTLKPLISQGFQVSASILVTQDGCGDRTRTCDLRVMRQSQGQIGVISVTICAFYHGSLGGSSIVSVQPCPFQFHSGSKLGQDRFTGNFQSRNVIYQCIPHRGDVDCTISVDIEIPGVLNDTPRNCFVLCLSFVGKLRY